MHSQRSHCAVSDHRVARYRDKASTGHTSAGHLGAGAQGIECHFLEQWHQKLHTNTTPEDITICEAYLAFLHSGHDGDFWQVLWDRGHITRDMLAHMDHPVTGEHPLTGLQGAGLWQHWGGLHAWSAYETLQLRPSWHRCSNGCRVESCGTVPGKHAMCGLHAIRYACAHGSGTNAQGSTRHP